MNITYANLHNNTILLDIIGKFKFTSNNNKFGKSDEELVYDRINLITYLAQKGVDLDAIDNEGKNLIDLSVSEPLDVQMFLYSLRITNDTAESDTGFNSMLNLAMHGNIEATKLLIARGDNVSYTDNFGGGVIMFASVFNHQDYIDELYKSYNLDLNVPNIYGITPIFMAASGSHVDLVKHFVEYYKIDANQFSYNGKNILQHVVGYLGDSLNQNNKLYNHAPYLSNEEIISNRLSTIKYLSKYNDINALDHQDDDKNLLHIAATSDLLEVFELLHSLGVLCEAKTRSGKTVLDLIEETGREELSDAVDYINMYCNLSGEDRSDEF